MKVARFQQALHLLKNAGEGKLSDIAYALDYADQSHFIQDFKEFSGFNPNKFLKTDSTETTNWTE